MTAKLVLDKTQSRYSLVDEESGYAFEIVTTFDAEHGAWNGTLVLKSHGMATEDAVIKRLHDAVRRVDQMFREAAAPAPLGFSDVHQ